MTLVSESPIFPNVFFMEKITVSLIQITSTENWEENLSRLRLFCKKAKSEGADLVCLPENFAFFGSEEKRLSLLEVFARRIPEFLSDISRECGIYVLGGGYPSLSPSVHRSYNTASLFSPQGERIYTYHKIHLFDSNPGDGVHYQESRTVCPGERIPKPVELSGGWNFASLICYDLRFPELFRSLSALDRQLSENSTGLDILCLPAAFTQPTGDAHWEVLLRARAIENLCYVVAPAQTGVHDSQGKRKTHGHSMVVDPWGEIMGELGREEGLLTVSLDRNRIDTARNKIPALRHRRIGVDCQIN